MKNTFILLLSLCVASVAYAQNVSITPTGITPAQGGSVQKLTYDAIRALPSPQPGDQAYDLTYNTMRYYNGQRWVDGQVNHPFKPSITGFRTGYTNFESKTKVDLLGNIYVVGSFPNSVTFGSTILTSAGSTDIYIAKYLPNETLSWAIKIGGSAEEVFRDFEIDANNNLVITGVYYGTTQAGAFTRTNADASGLTRDIFITKINPSNTVLWLNGQGNSNNDDVTSIAIDNANNPYISGSFSGTITEGLATITSAGLEDIFIRKVSSVNGNGLQLIRAGGTTSDRAQDILILPSDNSIYLTGYFTGTAAFGSSNLVSAGGLDAFIAKYSQTVNNWESAFSGGGTSDDVGEALTTNNTSTIFLAGTFIATANLFGSSRTSAGGKDIFVAKFGTALATPSVYRIGDILNDEVNDILFISPEKLYMCGSFRSSSATIHDATYAQVSVQNKGYIMQIGFVHDTILWSEIFLSKAGFSNLFSLSSGPNQALYCSGFASEIISLWSKSIFGNFILKLEH
jgi:hypothetical protein